MASHHNAVIFMRTAVRRGRDVSLETLRLSVWLSSDLHMCSSRPDWRRRYRVRIYRRLKRTDSPSYYNRAGYNVNMVVTHWIHDDVTLLVVVSMPAILVLFAREYRLSNPMSGVCILDAPVIMSSSDRRFLHLSCWGEDTRRIFWCWFSTNNIVSIGLLVHADVSWLSPSRTPCHSNGN